MQILETYSSSGQALHDVDETADIINPKSINRLEVWTKDLLEEEAVLDPIGMNKQFIDQEQSELL